ncbi:efflux RND transporter periplasmic adaptor subunit [Marinicella sp. W31]|uniref:efflux RND transporter periplasmic adaptor subunit n=1 Tax=Marinicella sp. W31 TaxID=3023713 RepID=UPI0037562E2E
MMRFYLLFLLVPAISQAQSPIPVTVQPLSELLVERELRAPAEVLAANRATIATEVAAVVESIHADVGQQVKSGDLLLQLQVTDYELAVQQAQANLASNTARIDQAKQRLKRANDLSEKNYISADDLLDRETNLVVLRAERQGLQVVLAQAKRNLNKCSIRAPFDGVVTARSGQVGSYLIPGTAVLTFVQSGAQEVEAEIPAHLSTSLAFASRLDFSMNGQNWPLKLSRLSPVIESGIRAQLARLNFAEQAAAIGSSGELIWSIPGGLLPADLVVSRNGQFGVFVVDGDNARFKPLPQAQEGRPVPMDEAGGLSIIVGGRERLQDGVAIAVE